MRAFRIIETLRNVFSTSTTNSVLYPGDVFPSLKDINWSDDVDEDQDPEEAFEQMYNTLSSFSR